MTDIAFTIDVVGGVPVVTVLEDVDITNADGLRSVLAQTVITHGHGALVVDLSRTQFCDTAGLHALLATHKQAQAEGGQVLLVMRGATVLRIFEITGLDRVIPHFRSLKQALARASAAPSADRGSPTG